MTYDELIEKMDDIDVAISNGFGSAKVFLGCVKAVRSIIELHKPSKIPNWVPTEEENICWCAHTYPCPTIQAIVKELE